MGKWKFDTTTIDRWPSEKIHALEGTIWERDGRRRNIVGTSLANDPDRVDITWRAYPRNKGEQYCYWSHFKKWLREARQIT